MQIPKLTIMFYYLTKHRLFTIILLTLALLFLFMPSVYAQPKQMQREIDSLRLELRLRNILQENNIVMGIHQNRLDNQTTLINNIQEQTNRWITFTEIFFGFVGVIIALFAFFGFRQVKHYSDMAKRDHQETEKMLVASKEQQKLIKERHDEIQKFKPEETLTEQNKKVLEKTLEEARKQLEKSGLDSLKNLYQAKAIKAYDEEDWTQTLRYCENYIDFDENNAEMWHRWARSKTQLGEQEKAMDGYNRALSLDPQLIRSYNNRSILFRNLKKYEESLLDINKAILLNPNYARGYLNRGRTYELKNDLLKAESDYNKAVELESTDSNHLIRSLFLIKRGKYQLAIDDLNTAIKLNPNRASTYFNRHSAYWNLNEKVKAKSDLEKAIELKPNNKKYRDAMFKFI